MYFNPRFPWGKRRRQGIELASDLAISIHASRGGSDRRFSAPKARASVFQSTLPVGEATAWLARFFRVQHDFNPRFPWGKRHKAQPKMHTSRIFQSTLPVGEATLPAPKNSRIIHISIHASRGGSDRIPCIPGGFLNDFNPRFPWGKRHPHYYYLFYSLKFQSTLPVGEATHS